MQMNNLRKTHPILLILAVAITVFSLLLSAAITGLIPSLAFENHGAVKHGATEQRGKKTVSDVMRFSTAGNVLNSERTAIHLPAYKNQVQPLIQPNSQLDDTDELCPSCGEIVSINLPKQEAQGYVIRIRMENGSYRTVTQYSEPHFSVGDEVELNSRKFTLA